MSDAPPTTRHTTIINTDHAVTVTLEEGDGSWFRMLNDLVLSGLWARLRNETRAALPVLACIGRQDGVCFLDSPDQLLALSSLSPSAWKRARRELIEQRLIDQIRPGCYRLFPGRPVWRSRTDRATGGPSRATGGPADVLLRATGGPPRATGGPPPKTGREKRRDDVVGGGALSPSQDPSAGGSDCQDAAGEDLGGGGVGALVLKSRGKLAERDIRSMLGRGHSLDRISDALANAMWKQTHGLKKSVLAYTWHCLNQGYELFEELRDAPAGGRKAPPLASRLRDLLAEAEGDMDQDTRDVLQAAFRGSVPLMVSKARITPALLDSLSPAGVVDHLRAAADRSLGRAAR